MITLTGLTKRYGERTVVRDLSTTIRPGRVTGFLGPNGAGKSTTMRMVLGLDRPTAGRALIDGRPYAALTSPMREVGAVLDARAVHPGRTARKHLLALARSNRLPARRVDEVLAEVGLTEAAGRRAGTFSLGMSQRLGIAGALLGDPKVLLFDEPVNGLDPDGVRWIREFMRSLATAGRTVFVSSHLMSEMQLTADHLLIIGRGELIADAPIGELVSQRAVKVRSPQAAALAERLGVRLTGPDELIVTGHTPERIGDLAYELGARVYELTPQAESLEEAYMALTADRVEYSGVAR